MRFAQKALLALPLFIALPSLALTDWQKPTAEELSMTSQPEVPGADAVYLFREEITEDREGMNGDIMDDGSDRLNYQSTYVRLKVLNEEGKKYADVQIPYDPRFFTIGSVQGRTIHSDGSIVTFSGKPFQKMMRKSRSEEEVATVFTMPDVQVGSILEYRYYLRYNSGTIVPPHWFVQQELFIRNGHYYFRPIKGEGLSGNNIEQSQVAYTASLPPGVAVKYSYSADTYELNIRNVAPLPAEEWMPPLGSISHRVLFYYTGVHTAAEYWATEGRSWSREVDRFAAAGRLKDTAAQIVGSTAKDEDRVEKIYDAVMGLENTSFTRERSAAENKAIGVNIRTAEDIWREKRGNKDELTLLFVGLVRAAGLNASAMLIADRDRAMFMPTYLSMDQLDDDVAIVQIDGKERFFDPGQKYCSFGQLQWTHMATGGLRQQGDRTVVAQTPGAGYQDSQTIRSAQLHLDAQGKISGLVQIKLTGAPALHWRQLGLRMDEAEVKREFEQSLQPSLPGGIEIKTNHFVGLSDWKENLLVLLDVSGGMGTASSKRIILPSSFFEASDPPFFVHEKREDPIDLHYPSVVQDTVSITLPQELAVESAPKDMRMPLGKNALYSVKYTAKPNNYGEVRVLVLANPFYEPGE